MGIWKGENEAGEAGTSHEVCEDGSWRREFAHNMLLMDELYKELPSLNVIRATALVGAMKKVEKASVDNGETASKLKSEWDVLSGENKKYVYGEINLITLSECLHRYCRDERLRSFVDLGSGSGRAVFSVAMNHHFTKLRGIELLPGLHSIADKASNVFESDIRPQFSNSGLAGRDQGVSFECSDFLQCDWSDADVVLAVSTCFPVELMAQIEARAAAVLKPGTIAITLTKDFKGDMWEKLGWCKRLHGWGPSVMHVYKLIRNVPEEEHLAFREGSSPASVVDEAPQEA